MLEPLAPGMLPASTDTDVKRDEKIEKACRDFEAILLATLMKDSAKDKISLNSHTQTENPFGALEDTAWEMTAQALSQEGDGLGLWKSLYESIQGNTPRR